MTSLRILSLATVALLCGGFALAAFHAPMDANEGFVQKIFYLHVPLALVALGGFVFGAVAAVQHLRSGDPRHDLRSYVAIHLSLVLGIAVLVTGAIWAKASWGIWWEWRETMLVSFLIVFLLYCTYQPLRFSIEDREKQSRYASVFAVTAGAFVPLCFGAVRAAESYIHPQTFNSTDNLPGSMWLAFLVCLAGMTLLFVTLWRFEIAHKMTRARVRSLKRRLGGVDDPVVGRSAAPQLSSP